VTRFRGKSFQLPASRFRRRLLAAASRQRLPEGSTAFSFYPNSPESSKREAGSGKLEAGSGKRKSLLSMDLVTLADRKADKYPS
jgi:hypothetical protein